MPLNTILAGGRPMILASAQGKQLWFAVGSWLAVLVEESLVSQRPVIHL